MARRDISRKTAGQRELDLVGNHPRGPHMSFHNEPLISLLFQIPNILQHKTCTTTTRSKSGAPIEIMVIVHGDFTGRMATISGKTRKAINHLLIFPIPLPIQ